jgi:hypothetical protein
LGGGEDRALSEPNRISETASRIGKRISLGKAAEIAVDSKRAFMDVLSRKGIPVSTSRRTSVLAQLSVRSTLMTGDFGGVPSAVLESDDASASR